MTRPGLIVGLGGTGQWVLTWLKRDLLLSNNGKMPNNVRLLSVDTASQLEAGASRVTTSGSKEEGAEVGGVALEQGEFIYIGGDSRPLATEIAAGEWPQMNWFQAQRWLANQSPATFILDDGAGRIRQFGRLAVFKDIIGQETGSILWRAFRAVMETVRATTNQDRRLEIMVVGSFAGGTGSGMFLDVALVLRMLAQEAGIHHVLRGFFALPNVFTNAPDADMQARTFAAWRELNRFMVVNPDFPMPLVEYVQNNPNFRISPDKRLFDACYLVDGRRGGQPLSDEPKYGVFPMMSEVISAMLDEKAGTAYTQWVFTNLAPEYAKRPDTPMYSAIGAYTVQVPAHFIQEESSHQLGQNILLNLLKPRQQPDQFGRLIASGAERYLILASPANNQEDAGFGGRMRCRQILTNPITVAGQTAKPTLFVSRIALLNQEASDAGKRPTVIERLATSSGKANSSDSWISYFPDLGDDQTYESLRKEAEDHTKYNIVSAYSRQAEETADDVQAKIRKIPNDIRTRFGGITSTGEEAEEYYGAFGEVLRKVANAQLTIFRRLTRLTVQDLLTGRSDNALIARSGKLGYTWDYFDGLAKELDNFIKLVADIKKRRDELKPQIRLAGLSKKAQEYMNAVQGKKIFWFWENPQVKGSELEYLQAQHRLMDIHREDILHVFVYETARAMKTIAEETRDVLQSWVFHLTTGDDASNLPGLWDNLRASQEQIKTSHTYDTRTPKVQRLLGDQTFELDNADLAKVLSRWQWQVEYVGDPPRFRLAVQILPEIAGDVVTYLNDPSTVVAAEQRQEIGKQNLTKFLNLARRNFMTVVARSEVTQAIRETYPNPKSFAETVANVSAEPLFSGRSGASPRKKSNIIRVKADDRDDYFGTAGLVGQLRQMHNLDPNKLNDTYGIQIVGSEHPYKLTLVRTDDLYDYEVFATWRETMNAYGKHVIGDGTLLDPTLLQNFLAESIAVTYERRLTNEPFNRAYAPLHPRVVMLLEDPIALRQFLYLGMFGMISDAETREGYRWELTWEKTRGMQTIWLTKPWNQDRDGGQRSKPDVFNAMHGYIIARRTQQPGRRDLIDMDFAQRLIDDRLRDMKIKGEIKHLEENLDENGFVGWLHQQAVDPDVPTKILHQDFEDLSLVARMFLEDRIEELERRLRRTQPTAGSKTGPFKVWPGNKPEEDVESTEPEEPVKRSNPFSSKPKEAS